jgi:hypothetical protein
MNKIIKNKGIIGILNNPATSINSHSAGMVNIVKELLDADVLNENDNWNNYEELIIYHGTNFKEGIFNIIGGINDSIITRAEKLVNYNGIIKTLDGFQLKDFSIKRKLNIWDNFKNIDKTYLPSRNNLVIGDSHSLSVWPDNTYEISRNDGKTLHGFLKQNLDLSKWNNIIMYFGNIDLRFHLCRQLNPKQSTIDLFNKYCDYASKYNTTLTMLLPIEDESRKIPKSGQYKNKNFYGSIEERKDLRLLANNIIKESKLNYLSWPSSFLNENGNLNFDIMEPRQSVHIRPAYYMKEIKKQLNLF